MRDYGVAGQIGLEPSPEEYIKKLVEVFRELKRVLKDSGSFYLNMGDTYGGSVCGFRSFKKNNAGLSGVTDAQDVSSRRKLPLGRPIWIRPKQLLLIPARLAIALQEDDWLLRNDIIWHKNNPMPCSVRDRLTNTYEHVFHFVKNERYWYDLDAIRVPHKHGIPAKFNNQVRGGKIGYKLRKGSPKHYKSLVDRVKAYRDANPGHGSNIFGNPRGKNPGDVVC